jgi:hypothetical protein
MEMMLFLPLEEQKTFADERFKHFINNMHFAKHQLEKAQNSNLDDPRSDEEGSWTSQELGNLAIMVEDGPIELREDWKRCYDKFVEYKKSDFKKSGGVPTASVPELPRK